MSLSIALAGNPNSGKTTLFNALTGLNQFVGNWPGVTVEKKEGRLKENKDVTIMDLPGIYSLSPYSLEEVVARDYLTGDRPGAILNIVDGTNIERNLYLTTQLLELGIPVVVAVNMIDLVEKKGDTLDTEELSRQLGCDVVRISALKGTGISEAAAMAVKAAERHTASAALTFGEPVERALSGISGIIGPRELISEEQRRFFLIKIFERDGKILERLNLKSNLREEIDVLIEKAEEEFGDDSESLITNERYLRVASIFKKCCRRKSESRLTVSDKIDRVVTNRWLALPLFALVMFFVYYVSVTTVGTWATDWANDGVFGEGWDLFGLWVPGVPVLVKSGLEWVGTSEWLSGLILDGIVSGVGAVLGFVPQMLVLFIFLAILEDCGYMARIAFIMDRIFRKFGMSGKSFIPILIGTGCGVPGLMASRAIENDRDRKMTLITTTFIPCGAKLPVIALIAGAIFNGEWWVAPSAYFVGMLAIISSGVLLKKTSVFSGEPAPFVMELPSYHLPAASNVCRSAWERGWSFVKKAGTIILVSVVGVWFLSSFGFVDGKLTMVELEDGMLASIGRSVAWIFSPLGFGDWKSAVATISGLVAKENVVGTFGVLYGFAEVAEDGTEIWGALAAGYTPVVAYSLLIFNLLCAPCFAAIGAIRREMNNWKWTLFAVAYQTGFAYFAAFCAYRYGELFTTGVFREGTGIALFLTAVFLFLVFRPQKKAARTIRHTRPKLKEAV